MYYSPAGFRLYRENRGHLKNSPFLKIKNRNKKTFEARGESTNVTKCNIAYKDY